MAEKKVLYVASTAPHLRRFHEPYLAALRDRYTVRTMACGDGVDYDIPFEKKIFGLRNLRVVRMIRAILRRERFDAVILNTSLAAAMVRFAVGGLRRRPRILNVVHGYLFEVPPQGLRDRLLLACERLLARRTGTVAVMNRKDLEVAERYRLSRGKVLFLHGMGLPEREIPGRDPERRAKYAGEGDLLLTYVGELSRRKNQSFLIRATARLRETGVPVRLLLIGEGDERVALEEEIDRLGLRDAVHLTGSLENVYAELAATDLYVSASRSEGLPFNLLEAMQCGLPILASDVRGQSDLLGSENLYPPGDLDAFCAGVARLAAGERGVGSVSYPALERYLLHTVLGENLGVFREVIEG